jgi:hypothetical protein
MLFEQPEIRGKKAVQFIFCAAKRRPITVIARV